MIVNDIRFIKGAVAPKDLVPVLKHVHIKNGVAQAFNGALALSCPLAVDKDIVPIAVDFIKALERCDGEPKITVTPAGKVKVTDGSFKVFVKAVPEASVSCYGA